MKKENAKVIVGLLIAVCGLIAMIYFGWQIAVYGWMNPDLTDRRILLDKVGEYIGFYAAIVVCWIGGRLITK